MNRYTNAAGLALMLVIGMGVGVTHADDVKSSDDTMMDDSMSDDDMMDDSMSDDDMMSDDMSGDMKPDTSEDMMEDTMSDEDPMMSDDMKTMDDEGMHGESMDR